MSSKVFTLIAFGILLTTYFAKAQVVPLRFRNKQFEDQQALKLKMNLNAASVNKGTSRSSDLANKLQRITDSISPLESINYRKLNSLYYGIFRDVLNTAYKDFDKAVSIKFANQKAGYIKDIDSWKDNASFNTDSIKDRVSRLYPNISIDEGSENDLHKVVKQIKSLSLYFGYKSRMLGHTFSLFPVHNATDAQYFYNAYISDSKYQILRNSLLSFGVDGGRVSLYNEIYADFFGPVRTAFGILVSNKQNVSADSLNNLTTNDTSTIQKDAIQRLIGGGGNGVLSFSIPVLNFENFNEDLFIKLFFTPKLGLDIPKFGTEKNDYAISLDNGLEGSVFYQGVNERLVFFSTFRSSVIFGNNVFYKNLNKVDRNSFLLSQFSIGFAISSFLRLSYNFYVGDGFVRSNFPHSISVSLVPAK